MAFIKRAFERLRSGESPDQDHGANRKRALYHLITPRHESYQPVRFAAGEVTDPPLIKRDLDALLTNKPEDRPLMTCCTPRDGLIAGQQYGVLQLTQAKTVSKINCSEVRIYQFTQLDSQLLREYGTYPRLNFVLSPEDQTYLAKRGQTTLLLTKIIFD